MSATDHKTDRRVFEKWFSSVSIRPNLSYDAKELSRTLSSPTEDEFDRLKHVTHYLKGAEDYRMCIVPKAIADNDETPTNFDSERNARRDDVRRFRLGWLDYNKEIDNKVHDHRARRCSAPLLKDASHGRAIFGRRKAL